MVWETVREPRGWGWGLGGRIRFQSTKTNHMRLNFKYFPIVRTKLWWLMVYQNVCEYPKWRVLFSQGGKKPSHGDKRSGFHLKAKYIWLYYYLMLPGRWSSMLMSVAMGVMHRMSRTSYTAYIIVLPVPCLSCPSSYTIWKMVDSFSCLVSILETGQGPDKTMTKEQWPAEDHVKQLVCRGVHWKHNLILHSIKTPFGFWWCMQWCTWTCTC